MKAKIRGIYATALAKLLLGHDFDIVQPSEEIAERFGLEASEDEPDLSIHNRLDLQGVEATGSTETIEALRTILRKELFDVVLRRKVEGSCLDIEFPWDSKKKLDEYRRTVFPTVQKHHYYKACGGEVSSAVDTAEKLLLLGSPLEKVEELFRQTIEPHLPYEGSKIFVEHVKLSGPALSLGKAVIESYGEGSCIKFVREIRSNGIYDGLGVEKEAGDRAFTEVQLGEYYTETRYYSQEERFKGAYINLNTPVEFYPSKIRYIDLEVDICVVPEGDVKVIDMDLLERAAGELIITGKFLEIVKEKVSEIKATIRDRFP
jgi:hypothetical protein